MRLKFIIYLSFLYLQLTAADLVINEVNYRSPNNQQNIEFIEIFNTSSSTVDISDWSLSDAVDFKFPFGTSIDPQEYLIVVSNLQEFTNEFPNVTTNVYDSFIGKLSNDGETIKLLDANCIEIDKVDYKSWQEWPNVRYANNGDSPISIQKINPLLPGKHGGSWAGGNPTPGQQNTVVFVQNSADVVVIESVSKSPDNPMTGEEVRIKVDVSKHDMTYQGTANLSLEYQINDPGSYVSRFEISAIPSLWTAVPLLDDGVGPDSTANNSVYTAIIPSSVQMHRRLIRYRIKLTQPNGTIQYFPDPLHHEMNYSYYVYDGYKNINGYDVNQLDQLQDITIIAQSSIVNYFIGQEFGGNSVGNQYQGNDYLGEGTLVHNGKVFDHIRFRPRGKGSRTVRDKPGIKIDLNNERGIKVEDDCGDEYKQERDKLILSGTWVNDIASHGLTESIIYKLVELTGGLPRYTDYSQLRIVDKAQETGNTGDFWGVFLILEDYEGDYLKEHDFAEGNFWDTDVLTRFRYLDHIGDFPGASTLPTFTTYNYDGPWTIDNKGHLPLLFGDRIANEMFGQNADNYVGKHSYKEYYDSESGKYHGWWGDMDNAFGSPDDDITVFPRSESDVNAPNANLLHVPSAYEIEFKNAFRSAYDLLFSYNDPTCNCSQTDFLVDQESTKIFDPSGSFDWATVDQSRWSQTYDLGDYPSHQQWYKTWFDNRKAYLEAQFADADIPNKPNITFTGQLNLDQLTFSNSPFSDPNGNSTFASMEWRVGEWSDPSNPYYNLTCDARYEIEEKWSSGEITSFSNIYQIPPDAKLKENRSYLIRVRYKDNSGRWSHWSDPIKLVPTHALNPTVYDLVINELMYNPDEPKHAEFIELYNNSGQAIDLSHVQFTEGIDYEFPFGASISGHSFICLAEDSAAFYKAYGSYPYGEYESKLSNSGELLRLIGPYRTIIDTVRYDDNEPWPGTPDKGLFSLALKNPSLDNALAENWSIQSVSASPCDRNEFLDFGEHPFSGIVINEIHYNPFDSLDSNGDVVEAGSEFEFLELKNISNSPIDMSGAFFSRGITYEFDPGTIIQAGDFFVLAEDNSSFEDRYGFVANDKYGGKLSNSGESIWLNQADGNLMDAVDYSSSMPWDTTANGGLEDLSLALIENTVDNNSRVNWQTQCSANFTPGYENDFTCYQAPNYTGLTINEIHFNPLTGSSLEFIEIVNHSTQAIDLKSVSITGGITYTFEEFTIPANSQYPSNYIVLASDVTEFESTFGVTAFDQYEGELNNAGELLIMRDLFGNIIDEVDFRLPIASTPAAESIGLIDLNVDNGNLINWCEQPIPVTPSKRNLFIDTDNDGVVDCKDQCPGRADQIAGSSCDDGDPCTEGDFFNQFCNCISGQYQDTDGDGICDAEDICQGHDDTIDLDNNGIPDGCEGCVDDVSDLGYPTIVTDTSAITSIETNGTVLSGTNIYYNAGQEIELHSGFKVEMNAVFEATISPCQ